MKISQEHKEEIQWFVYFLFKGTLDSELISNHRNYVRNLIQDPKKLLKCFEIFASSKSSGKNYKESTKEVTAYIINDIYDKEINLSPFWSEFVNISKVFSYSSFEFKVKSFDLSNLDGCGTDAVPFFAVWTNTIEIDEHQNCINANSALKRANERLLIWDSNENNPTFDKEELKQEIY